MFGCSPFLCYYLCLFCWWFQDGHCIVFIFSTAVNLSSAFVSFSGVVILRSYSLFHHYPVFVSEKKINAWWRLWLNCIYIYPIYTGDKRIVLCILIFQMNSFCFLCVFPPIVYFALSRCALLDVHPNIRITAVSRKLMCISSGFHFICKQYDFVVLMYFPCWIRWFCVGCCVCCFSWILKSSCLLGLLIFQML